MDTCRRCALLVIDIQRELFQKSTPLYLAEGLLDKICSLVERAHEAGAPVFYVQHSADRQLVQGSEGWQLHPRLQPTAQDGIIQKRHGNAFEETTLHQELQERQVGCVVISGLVTHGCVKATCLGAQALGYRVILVQDGHSSYSKDAARLIEEWNRTLGAAGVELQASTHLAFH